MNKVITFLKANKKILIIGTFVVVAIVLLTLTFGEQVYNLN